VLKVTAANIKTKLGLYVTQSGCDFY